MDENRSSADTTNMANADSSGQMKSTSYSNLLAGPKYPQQNPFASAPDPFSVNSPSSSDLEDEGTKKSVLAAPTFVPGTVGTTASASSSITVAAAAAVFQRQSSVKSRETSPDSYLVEAAANQKPKGVLKAPTLPEPPSFKSEVECGDSLVVKSDPSSFSEEVESRNLTSAPLLKGNPFTSTIENEDGNEWTKNGPSNCADGGAGGDASTNVFAPSNQPSSSLAMEPKLLSSAPQLNKFSAACNRLLAERQLVSQSGAGSSAGGFVFGQNLSNRVIGSSDGSGEEGVSFAALSNESSKQPAGADSASSGKVTTTDPNATALHVKSENNEEDSRLLSSATVTGTSSFGGAFGSAASAPGLSNSGEFASFAEVAATSGAASTFSIFNGLAAAAQQPKNDGSAAAAITTDTGEDDEKKSTSASAGFVFGQNLSERATNSVFKTAIGSSSAFNQSSSALPSSGGIAIGGGPAPNHFPVVSLLNFTGEEDESNVIQLNAKLYVFDSTKKSWLERARGVLRLNDLLPSGSRQLKPVQRRRQGTLHPRPHASCTAELYHRLEGGFPPAHQQKLQSRLIMRTQGTLNVSLNAKVWSGMSVEKAGEKSLRFRALEDGVLKAFLVTSNARDTEQLFHALDHRVQVLLKNETADSYEIDIYCATPSYNLPNPGREGLETTEVAPSHEGESAANDVTDTTEDGDVNEEEVEEDEEDVKDSPSASPSSARTSSSFDGQLAPANRIEPQAVLSSEIICKSCGVEIDAGWEKPRTLAESGAIVQLVSTHFPPPCSSQEVSDTTATGESAASSDRPTNNIHRRLVFYAPIGSLPISCSGASASSCRQSGPATISHDPARPHRITVSSSCSCRTSLVDDDQRNMSSLADQSSSHTDDPGDQAHLTSYFIILPSSSEANDLKMKLEDIVSSSTITTSPATATSKKPLQPATLASSSSSFPPSTISYYSHSSSVEPLVSSSSSATATGAATPCHSSSSGTIKRKTHDGIELSPPKKSKASSSSSLPDKPLSPKSNLEEDL